MTPFSADCASGVSWSASSRRIICSLIPMRVRGSSSSSTKPIPRVFLLDALNTWMGHPFSLARTCASVVFPVPASLLCKMACCMLSKALYISNAEPTSPSDEVGRYLVAHVALIPRTSQRRIYTYASLPNRSSRRAEACSYMSPISWCDGVPIELLDHLWSAYIETTIPVIIPLR